MRHLLIIAAFISYFCIPVVAQNSLTSAESQIVQANSAIAQSPESWDGYNRLAEAYVKRARQTSDLSLYSKAEESIRKSLELQPDNLSARKTQVMVLLGRHDFDGAFKEATALNKAVPDDVLVYGLLADAAIALGNYPEAEHAAQWMLDMRPGNIPGLIRGAELRELFGDHEGAIEFLRDAYQQTDPIQSEDRAFLLGELAHLSVLNGRISDAEGYAQSALNSNPGYLPALEALTQVSQLRGQEQEASRLLDQRRVLATRLEDLYDLAAAFEAAGRSAEAKLLFEQFETRAQQESTSTFNHNVDLILYYSDHSRQKDALDLANLELNRHKDVYTMEAAAWALYSNARYQDAKQKIEKALATGIRDSRMLRRAGLIEMKANDLSAARLYLGQAAELNSLQSNQARLELERLPPLKK